MEWSGRPLTEELCVAILRHLEPRHLAAVSACPADTSPTNGGKSAPLGIKIFD